jgi:hypothetical protein
MAAVDHHRDQGCYDRMQPYKPGKNGPMTDGPKNKSMLVGPPSPEVRDKAGARASNGDRRYDWKTRRFAGNV